MSNPIYTDTTDLVCLGQIVAAHGIQGEVKIRSFTQDPRHLGAYGPLILLGCEDRLSILKLRAQKGDTFVARFKEVVDRNTAELLKGQKVYVTQDKLPPVDDPDAFYIKDLEGMTVQNTAGDVLGHVVGVLNFGAGDNIEIKLLSQKETILIPFIKEWVVAVDMAKNKADRVMQVDTDYLAEYLQANSKDKAEE